MGVSFGTVQVGSDVSLGNIPLAQMSVGPVVVWECVPANCVVLTVEEPGTAEFELPIGQFTQTEYEVDWGDGVKNKLTNKHTYADGTGTRRIVITGSAVWNGFGSQYYASKPLLKSLKRVEVNGVCPLRMFGTYAFCYCQVLEGVDENLFNGVVATSDAGMVHQGSVVDYYGVFQYCRGLKGVPEGLFANAGYWPASVTRLSLHGVFGYSGLTEVPAGLFKKFGSVKVTWSATTDGVLDFGAIFNWCTGLKSVPTGLFGALPTQVQSYSFSMVFCGCTGLTGLPSDLFSKLPSLGGSSSAVRPRGLSGAFQGCSGLKSVPGNIVSAVPNDSKSDLSVMFSGCSGITGALPTLWSSHASSYHDSCFNGCTAASNWGSVPSGWR